MTLLECDFKDFLIKLGYSRGAANLCWWHLKLFARNNKYKTMIDLADDVFILLDRGVHFDRQFNKKTLSNIRRNEKILTLFNSFLFDIYYQPKFIVHRSSPIDYKLLLVTDQKYIPGVCPRTVHDDTDESKTRFTSKEVYLTLHISDRTLRYWAENGKRPRQHRDEHGKIYYTKDELNDFLREWFEKKDSKTRDNFMRP